MSETQNFQHHARFFPPLHFVVMPIFVVNLVWSIYRVVRAFSADSVISLLIAVALLLLAVSARVMTLTVQDRVIRLEMQLRMQQVLPADLRSRIRDFTVSQLVALRFAGDGELPELARKVLQDKITDRKAIKQLVRDWQPDFQRA
jgi:cell division protein FtsL